MCIRDRCWKALGDPAFAPFVKHKQKTIRKMNGLGLFDTQEVADLLSNCLLYTSRCV